MICKLKKFFFRKLNSNELIENFNPFTFSENAVFNKKYYFTYLDLKNEVLDYRNSKTLVYSVYHMVTKNSDSLFFESLNFKPSLFVVKPGFLGREYNKTNEMFVNYKGESRRVIFEVLSGQGYFLIQREKSVEIDIVKVEKGSYVLIPKESKFVIINTSGTNLVCFSLVGKNTKFERVTSSKDLGAVLFYTKAGFVRNMNHGPIYHLNEYVGDYVGEYLFDKEKGIYKECIYLPEKFKFLLD